MAKSIDPANTDLAYLAVVGACGDMQDSGNGLSGINRMILDDAVSNGSLEIKEDVRLYGRETRPLVGFLQYSSDPEVPGLSNDQEACNAFYSRLGIPLRKGGRNRCWTDLSENEGPRRRGSPGPHEGEGPDQARGGDLCAYGLP